MSLGVVLQDPDATSPYSEDWTAFLAGGTIGSSAWSILPAGPTISGATFSGAVTTCYVAGVVEGQLYQLTNRVTPTGGQPEERSITIRGGQR